MENLVVTIVDFSIIETLGWKNFEILLVLSFDLFLPLLPISNLKLCGDKSKFANIKPKIQK